LVSLELKLERRPQDRLWNLQLAAIDAVVHFPVSCLLKADDTAALNTPFSHWRKASNWSAASFAYSRHLEQPPIARNLAGIY
jgi:hypothetical protein